MSKHASLLAIIPIIIAGLACNLLSNQGMNAAMTAIAQTAAASTGQPQQFPPTVTQAVAAPSATQCAPRVTATTNANVRSGPGTGYDAVGAIPAGGTAPLAGRNDANTWWYIEFAGGSGGHAWIAQNVTSTSCLPAVVQIIAAPPLPTSVPQSGTCKPGYVYREAGPGDNICVPPASKAQAQADNAAASSRKIVNVYGPDACISGYVWRDAFSGDHVCVTLDVRSQAAADNAAAASRWVSGWYGPHTCIEGYVWREAQSGDDVCVTADVRSQAAADNAAASSRVAINVYGPDACVSGYVWRDAFPGDHVCVTLDVRSQAAADNAAAPSHTWP